MGNLFSAQVRFLARFAPICPLTNSNLGTDVFRLDRRDFEAKSPFDFPELSSTTAIAAVQHAIVLASENKCRSIPLVFPDDTKLLGT